MYKQQKHPNRKLKWTHGLFFPRLLEELGRYDMQYAYLFFKYILIYLDFLIREVWQVRLPWELMFAH
jgi:hypothetical protein